MTQDSTLPPGSTSVAPQPDNRSDATGHTLTVVPVRSWGQWVAAAVVVALAGYFALALATNENVAWESFWEFLFNEQILRGIVVTVQITIVAFVAGSMLGLLVAICRLSRNPVLSIGAAIYVWFFRAMPLVLMIFLLGNIALLFPDISLGIPGTGIVFWSTPTNTLVTVFVAAVIAITISDAAPIAEVIRGAIIGVARGQTEAAKALGLNVGLTLRKIVLPQAFRTMIPPLANQFVMILKQTSLVAVIAGGDLMTEVANIYAVNFRTIELLFVATFWYLVLVSIASLGQSYLERRSNRGYR
jgi:polar amino acid transport system permease protein